MNYTFHPEAEAELLNAIDYYEDCEIGLGYDFSIKVTPLLKALLASQKLGLSLKTKSGAAKPDVFLFADIIYG